MTQTLKLNRTSRTNPAETMDAEKYKLFEFLQGYASWAEEYSTEKWVAAHVDACEMYNNRENKEHCGVTCVEFYDVMQEYITWLGN